MAKEKAKQEWYCEKCDILASCTISTGSDVYSGVNLIDASHAKKSPKCHAQYRIGFVRVRAPGCSGAEWKKVREDARVDRIARIKERFIVDRFEEPGRTATQKEK